MQGEKCAIIGLGHFGLHLALDLTHNGIEVLAIDQNQVRAEILRDKVAHTIIANSRDYNSLESLGLKDFDFIVVAIGEDFESSLLTVSHLQDMKCKKIIARATSIVHERILKQMKVDQIILPEAEAAKHLGKKLHMRGVVESLEVSKDFTIVEVEPPAWVIGKTLKELDLRNSHKINLVTLARVKESDEMLTLGKRRNIEVMGIIDIDRKLEPEDYMILFGKEKDIEAFLGY